MNEVFKKTRPYVTMYGSQMDETQHGTVATVGGQVINILNTEDLMFEPSFAETMELGAYLTIDDGIETLSVFVQRGGMQKYEELVGPLSIGDIILSRGKVHSLETVHRETTKSGTMTVMNIEENQTVRLLAYGIGPLPE